MTKKIIVVVLLLPVLAVAGIFLLAWRPSIDPVEPPDAASFAPERIALGERLAGAGNCATCHTVEGGAAYAGGRGLPTPFGVIYSTNITPDPGTGIGRWSEAAFVRAMREGVRPDGKHYYPAFPYTHYTRVRDEDLSALYAYFMTREPVVAKAEENTLVFPLNIRAFQVGWKLLFFDEGVHEPASGESAAWNRGAYLAEGLGHCSACHTPRNAFGAERADAAYAGATLDGWYAPALTAANPAPLPWTAAELYAYLRTGTTVYHGVAAGSMSEVVHQGLSRLPDEDIEALATYFAALAESPGTLTREGIRRALEGSDAAVETSQTGATLYAAACESCHYNSGFAPLAQRPALALNSALTGPDASTFVRVVLEGIGGDEGMQGVLMPGFSEALSDADLVALAEYLREAHAGADAWPGLADTVAALREAADDAL